MQGLELAWLLPTILQVTGLAVALGVLGMARERAIRERRSLLGELQQGHASRWLALAGIIFAAGMFFTRAGWEYKAIAIILAGLLIGLAWTSPRNKPR